MEEIMGGPIDARDPCAKGPVPYCLDECSKQADARTRLEQLRDAIKALAGANYVGLEDVFKKHLLPLGFPNPTQQQAIADHLKRHWFDESSGDAFFPKGEKTTEKYAKGVIETVELSLKGQSKPVTINAWWVLDNPNVKLLAMAEVNGGYTISDSVTLLILTPRPRGEAKGATPILGKVAQAWVTELAADGSVVTRQVTNRP
jgi:hypothetical protein